MGFLAVLLAGVLFSMFAAAFGEPFREGMNDFAALYQGGRLAGTGQLYDADAQRAWQRQHWGGHMPAVVFTRLPFYALLLRPLAELDYQTAWRIFLLVNIGCALWFYWSFLRHDPPALLLGTAFLPAYAALVNGQDVWIAAALFALAVRLAGKGEDFTAGLVLSLCAIKPHLFVFVPLVLVIHGRWRWLAGVAAGGTVLLGLSFLSEGPGWLGRYITELSDPRVHERLEAMPTLRNLVCAMGAKPWLLWPLTAVVVAVVIRIGFRKVRLEVALAGALAGALLVNYHAYIADLVLLLPAFVLLKSGGLEGVPLRIWGVILSPLPFMLFVRGGVFAAALPLAVLAGLGAVAAWSPGKRDPRHEPGVPAAHSR